MMKTTITNLIPAAVGSDQASGRICKEGAFMDGTGSRSAVSDANSVFGDEVLWGANLSGQSILWGTAGLGGERILWGTDGTTDSRVLWGNSVLWGTSAGQELSGQGDVF